MLLFFIILLIIVLILLIASYLFFNVACNKKDKNFKKIFKKMGMDSTSRYNLENVEWLKQQKLKDLYITSQDGLKLHASLLSVNNPQRTVVCVHGYRGSGLYDFSPMIKFFNETSTNVVLIDLRACGKSEGKYITYGAKEKHDVISWLKYVSTEIDTKNPIYLYGISMGASTSLLTLEYDLPNHFAGVIADCGYCSMKYECKYLFSKVFNLPGFFVDLVDIFCNIIGRFSMSETVVKNSLKVNRFPILFIHGDADTFVLPENTRINYSNTNSSKEIEWVSGANHGESAMKNTKAYQDKIKFFFNQYK